MKILIVPSVLASLLFVVSASANEINGNNDNCASKLDSRDCFNRVPGVVPPPPPVVVAPPPPPPPPRPGVFGDGYGDRWHRRNHGGVYFNFQTDPYRDYYDYGYDEDYIDTFADRCTAIGQSLRRSGFKRVRAIGCGGRNYIYSAVRDGEALRITVSRRTGRIIKIRPIY